MNLLFLFGFDWACVYFGLYGGEGLVGFRNKSTQILLRNNFLLNLFKFENHILFILRQSIIQPHSSIHKFIFIKRLPKLFQLLNQGSKRTLQRRLQSLKIHTIY